MNRRVVIQTPVGDQLQFKKLHGQEALSELSIFEIDLVSSSKSIDPSALLGQSITLEVETDGGGKRYLNGICTQFGMQGMLERKQFKYKMRVRPWLWLATRKTDFKIFQNKTVPDIISEVLGKYGYAMEKRLSGHYRTWDYCVQYRESDFAYVSRLMEMEGIYYFNTHSSGNHTLVLADDIVGSHTPLPGGETIKFYPPDIAVGADVERIYQWELHEEINPSKHFNDDYDFTRPKTDLSNMRKNPPGHAHDMYENYAYPGGFTQFPDGENYAKVRMEQQLSPHTQMGGMTNHRCLAVGYTFNLDNYPREDQNQQYLLTGITYDFVENTQVTEGGKAEGSTQKFTFSTQPTTRNFRPQRVTPIPRPSGPETAVVVGPAGEEIYTDKYGRVKVQFHWDRNGKMDENSSCWIRVSHPWAGLNYGSIHIPRIGQEVIIEFIHGDVDYPLITGRVYNGIQMPPWKLPDNKTQSGTLTNWSKGGGGANMLRFEDKKGVEHLELSTTYGQTYLNMGYLMHQGSGTQRSYGFELRTNLWGSIRADKGLLITTYTQDHTSKIAHDSPDGFDGLGDGLSATESLMKEAGSAVEAMNGAISAINSLKSGHMSELGAGVMAMVGKKAAASSLGKMAAALSAFTGGGGGGAAPEASMPTNTDPAMPQAQNLRTLSKDISKPIVSIVSPEGQSIISPKPVVVSSGQSVSMHAKDHITLSSGAQLTQLAKGGMLTHVSKGGQRNTVTEGDVASEAQAGHMNLTAKQNITMASKEADATVVGDDNVNIQATKDSVLVKAGKHIRLEAAESITLVVAKGKAYIKLTDEGDIEIVGIKKGTIKFADDLDEFGKKINLNCG
jgi:type VI secretion system secreted protein VgrG